MTGVRTLLIGGQAVTCAGPAPRRGPDLDEVTCLEGGALLLEADRIVSVGPAAALLAEHAPAIARGTVRVHDHRPWILIPGLVDPHTHAVFAGNRALEYDRRLRGDDYLAILQSGGGILESVRTLRAASAGELADQTRDRLRRMLAHGTTTAEVKSGYGLDLEAEVKTMEVLGRLAAETPVELVGTFLGAHAFPPEVDRSAYVDRVVDEMLPAMGRFPFVRYCDVFCDRGVFDLVQTERILGRARELGLGLRLHADEIAALGGTELACSMGAASVDHLVEITDAGIRALAGSPTAGILLPGTSLCLGKHYAPARRMIDAGCALALATDLNPGSCHNESQQFTLALACAGYRMTAAEALNAATLNAAWSLGLADRVGSLEPGKQADVLVLGVEDYREIPYRLGVNHVRRVYKRGAVVFEARG